MLQDEAGSNKQKHSFIGGPGSKHPLKEQLLNDFNLPKAANNEIFAKASVEALRFLSGSPRQVVTTSGLENAAEVNRPKISLLARQDLLQALALIDRI